METAFWDKWPNHPDSTQAADQGSVAHDMCERLVLYSLSAWIHGTNEIEIPEAVLTEPTNANVRQWMSDSRTFEGSEPDSVNWLEMLRHAWRYVENAQSIVDNIEASGNTALVFVEERLKMERIHPLVWGTGDLTIVDVEGGEIYITDLKYGVHRVDVSSPQLKAYGQGAFEMLTQLNVKQDLNFVFQRMHVQVFQPRTEPENINTMVVMPSHLKTFCKEMRGVILEALGPTPSYNPSEDACRFCKGRQLGCEARGQYAMRQLAEASDFDELDSSLGSVDGASHLMSDETVGNWCARISTISGWINEIQAVAYARAVDGKTIPGMKLVEGRGAWIPDEDMVEFIMGDEARKEAPVVMPLKSKSQLEKELGRKQFNTLLGSYYTKAPGKPALVSDLDPREPMVLDNSFLAELEAMDSEED